MKRSDILGAVADERVVLVGDLERLRSQDWESPSLCDGWKVRDVVGHLVRLDSLYRYSFPFFLGVAKYGLRLNTYIREDAIRRARGDQPQALLDAFAATRYETTIGARIHPLRAIPLSEVVIHGQDIRRSLGIERRFEPARLIPIADLLRQRFGVWGRGGRPSNVRFEATDADWSWGQGETFRAPMENIVMRLAGRNV